LVGQQTPLEGGDATTVILVVEDDVIVRMLACDILIDAGHHTLEAVDAAEALRLLEARPDIALIFSDVDMPGEINGLGLARLVSLKTPDLPMIITSGGVNVAPGDLPTSARFLQKPYSPDALRKLVEAMVASPPA
jgi:CheY-like chemotaxis protein